MDWVKFAVKLPMVASGIYNIVNKIRGASQEDKKAAVLESVMESVALAEFGLGKDLLNDATISKLLATYLDAEAVVSKAREALKAGILIKSKTVSIAGSTVSILD